MTFGTTVCQMKCDRQISAESRKKIPQSPFVNSEVTGSMFTKFLHNVEALLMHVSTRRYCIPFWNAKAKREGGQFRRLQKPQIYWLL